jgi:hypothetical protein
MLKPLLICIRIDLAGKNTDADVLGFSRNLDLGGGFMETVAARDIYGKFWDFRKNGSPCFDPFTDEGELKPLPVGKFIMWDELEQHPDIPNTTKASITAYAAAEANTNPNDLSKRQAIRRFKLSLAQPTINDLMATNTDGDRLLEETIRKQKYINSGFEELEAATRAAEDAKATVKIEGEEEEEEQAN